MKDVPSISSKGSGVAVSAVDIPGGEGAGVGGRDERSAAEVSTDVDGAEAAWAGSPSCASAAVLVRAGLLLA